MYRAADDIFRKTKQTVEFYINGDVSALKDELTKFAGTPVNETGDYPEHENEGK